MKREVAYPLLALAVLAAFLVLAGREFPKSASRLPGFLVVVLLDAYLWRAIRERLRQRSRVVMGVMGIVYWLPLAAVVGLVFTASLVPHESWNKHVKVHLLGCIFICYATKVFPLLALLVDDARRLIALTGRILFRPGESGDSPDRVKITRSRFLSNLGLLGGGVVLSGLVMGVLRWACDFDVRKERIQLDSLPRAFDGFRVVQISDLHLGSWTSSSSLEEVVRIINALEGDLVLFTGDLVDHVSAEANEYRGILSRIRSRHGVFAVLGNHDYGEYSRWESARHKRRNMDELERFFGDVGWNLLRNSHRVLERDGNRIAIVGIENWSIYERFPRLGDLEASLAGVEEIPTKILMSHDPTFWEARVQGQRADVELTFSGHTHGYQLGIETPRFRWSPAQYRYTHWAGLYSCESHGTMQYLYVNRGTGNNGFPGRVGILPEITIIELYGRGRGPEA